ncbi:hypothetical protein HOE67_02295 [Candidatus Peregrinibacteria bacterium]|jgi:hypothetical protein|nr:hypothetical protein [Candidatus Peregrinibacteria bacterium]MBT4055919.1 hypothetical protein [Candidatus Peregrinibacteria bacterium]
MLARQTAGTPTHLRPVEDSGDVENTEAVESIEAFITELVEKATNHLDRTRTDIKDLISRVIRKARSRLQESSGDREALVDMFLTIKTEITAIAGVPKIAVMMIAAIIYTKILDIHNGAGTIKPTN